MPELAGSVSLSEVLKRMAEDALEEMFFGVILSVEGTAEPGPECVCAQVEFRGYHSGSLTVALSPEAAVDLSANFLGVDPSAVTAEQTELVASELANIICGSALSRWQVDSSFDLQPPRVGSWAGSEKYCSATRLQLENGFLWLGLESGRQVR